MIREQLIMAGRKSQGMFYKRENIGIISRCIGFWLKEKEGVRSKSFGIANILRLEWKDEHGKTLSCKKNEVLKGFFSLVGYECCANLCEYITGFLGILLIYCLLTKKF